MKPVLKGINIEIRNIYGSESPVTYSLRRAILTVESGNATVTLQLSHDELEKLDDLATQVFHRFQKTMAAEVS